MTHFSKASIVALTTFILTAAADTAVIPPSSADEDTPNAVLLFPIPGHRFQFLYRSEDLLPLMPNGARISAIAFRNDAQGGAAGSTIVQDVEIRMGTTPSLSPVLSTEFAQNIGPDYKVVYQRGQLPLSSRYFPGQVNPFDWKIPLSTEFEYYARNGNLLIDVFTYSSIDGPPAVVVDMAPFSPNKTVLSISGAAHPDARFGTPETAGPVLQITFSQIPEPTVAILFSLGLFLFYQNWRKLR